ncbi:EpsG family protein [Vibrio splendidus]
MINLIEKRFGYEYGYLLLAIVFAIFSPLLLMLLSIISLVLVGFSDFKGKRAQTIFYLSGIMGIFAISLSAASQPVFLFTEQDFTTYYNNYLDFYNYGFSTDFFMFGAGYEIGVPLLNNILALVINGPYPNFYKFFQAFIQCSLVFYLVTQVKKTNNLSYREACLLLGLIFLFFKYPSTLNHLRQGYSSIFILIAVFSTSRFKIVFFVFLASIFHSSALVLYFLVRFLLTCRDTVKIRSVCVFLILFSVFLFLALKPLTNFVINSDILVLGKLVWGLEKARSTENIIDNLKFVFAYSMYVFPLIGLILVRKLSGQEPYHFTGNLIMIIICIVAYFYIPAIPVRALSSIYLIFVGYMYFEILKSGFLKEQLFSMILLIVIFFFVRWATSPLLYYNFPFADVMPINYGATFFVESNYVDRHSLPSQNDMVVSNPNGVF